MPWTGCCGVARASALRRSRSHHARRQLRGEEDLVTAVMEGVRILEVAEHTFVPAASALLADLGAEGRTPTVARTTCCRTGCGRASPWPSSSTTTSLRRLPLLLATRSAA